VAKVDVKVPDIGDFKDVPVIEVLVKVGDVVKAEQSLISLESDKATMDVPSPVEGAIAEILADYPDVPLVLDPVLASGRGDELASDDMLHALRELLLPRATLLTPNSTRPT